VPVAPPETNARNRMRVLLAALALAALLAVALIVIVVTPRPSPRLCGKEHRSVADGSYLIQNDEWNSSAPQCISYSTTDAAFSVTSTSINMPSGGAPGGYPSVSYGCFYSYCTRRSGLPRMIASLKHGSVTSDWSTTQPDHGSYDASYDIWFDSGPYTGGAPNGAEMMIWLGHRGGVQPLGSPDGEAAIDGGTYLVWYGYGSGASVPTITYEAVSPATKVWGLDITDFIQDAEGRGYLQPQEYLTDVQTGFELWQGGLGLATDGFSVRVR
jgi:hypothetical protein